MKWNPATALAALGQLLCAAAVLTFVAWSAGGGQQRAAAAAASKGSPIGLSVTAPQSVKSGDPVTLTLTVANQSGAPCSLSPQPDGTVGLVVARDGVRQFPSMGAVQYEQPLPLRIAKTARVVAPDGQITVGLASVRLHDGTQVLGSVSLSGQYAVGAQWSLSAPGRYTIGVNYSMPGGRGACTGLSGTATVTVAVTPCTTQHSGLALWLPKTLGGLGALATVAALALTIGTGRRRVVRAVTTCGVLLLGLGTPGMAQAKMVPAPADKALGQAVSDCMAIISKNDPAHIAANMERNGFLYNIVRVTDHDDSAQPIVNNGNLEALIKWNPDETGMFDAENIPIYGCAELYHEMVHAFDMSVRSIDDTMCGGDGDMYADIRATWLENEFRRRLRPYDKGFLRTMYDKKLLPPVPPRKDGEEEAAQYQYHNVRLACGDKGPGKTGVGGKHNSQGGGPGGSNGDPHMTTFDGARYDFQTVGEFVLAKADGFEVQERQSPLFQTRDASVNSALGMRVGSDRLSFSQEDGLRIRVDGTDAVFTSRITKLPGGGSVAVDEASGEYTVSWPDGTVADIVAIGGWGLRIEIYPSEASRGRTHGLLGDDDGNRENDLVTSAGATLPIPPDLGRLHGAFADTWRVTDATSLLPYPAGKNTASFTDRTFPDQPLDLGALPPEPRTQAEAVCRSLGIVDPTALDDCAIDVGLSGQPAFATSAAAADDEAGPANRPVVPPVVVAAGGTLRDGYVAQGDIRAAGQEDTFHLDVGNAPAVYLVDVEGLDGKSGQPTLNFYPDGPYAGEAPAFVYTVNYLYPLVQGASYSIKVSRPGDDTGPYRFRLVTAKENRTQLTFDKVVNGNLEQPGRADIYRFVAPRTGRLYLEDPFGCDISAGVGEDKPRVRVYTPHSVCWTDQAVAEVESGKSYALALWSFDVKEGPYSFRAVVK